MSLDLDLQRDLHEAFRLLYEDEDDFDADWADDDAESDTGIAIGHQPAEEASLGSSKYSRVSVIQTGHCHRAELTDLTFHRNACKTC
jgi:hypothetical protein